MWFLLSHIVAATCSSVFSAAEHWFLSDFGFSMSSFTFLTDALPAGEVEPFINHFSVQFVQKTNTVPFFYVWLVLWLHRLITSCPRCVIKKSHWLRSNLLTGQFWRLPPCIIATMWTYGGKSISGEVTAGRAALDRTSCVCLPPLVSQRLDYNWTWCDTK